MTARTVRFTQPSRREGIDAVQAPGGDEVTGEEEQTSRLANQGWQRIAATVAIPRDGTKQDHCIDSADFDPRLLRDRAPAVLSTSET